MTLIDPTYIHDHRVDVSALADAIAEDVCSELDSRFSPRLDAVLDASIRQRVGELVDEGQTLIVVDQVAPPLVKKPCVFCARPLMVFEDDAHPVCEPLCGSGIVAAGLVAAQREVA